MNEEYWLDKVDVFIENQIKGECYVKRTRSWVSGMGTKLDRKTQSSQNKQSLIIKGSRRLSKGSRI